MNERVIFTCNYFHIIYQSNENKKKTNSAHIIIFLVCVLKQLKQLRNSSKIIIIETQSNVKN